MIDEIPALAALGALLPEGAEMSVHGAGELRVKESDRISCLATGLEALGASVEEYPDGFRLVSRPLTGGTVDAADDHRLAMAFAIAATGAAQPTTILGASSVGVSYPGFFDASSGSRGERPVVAAQGVRAAGEELAGLPVGHVLAVGVDDADLIVGRERAALRGERGLVRIGGPGESEQPLGHAEDLL